MTSLTCRVLLLATCVVAMVVSVSSSGLLDNSIKTQVKCTEVTRQATRDCSWAAGLNSYMDQLRERGRIVAYKIRWFNGRWSGWYVPGVNDLDWKINARARTCGLPLLANTVRRVWAYFEDHEHKFIICKPT